MKSFGGKGLLKNNVILYLYKQKFELVYKFDNEKEAETFFNTFKYDTKSFSIFKYLQIKFCNHEKEYDLEVGPKSSYKVCNKCNRAVYEDRETEEEREKRIAKGVKLSRKYEILELEEKLKEEIIYKTKLIENLKKEYKSNYNEDYNEETENGNL